MYILIWIKSAFLKDLLSTPPQRNMSAMYTPNQPNRIHSIVSYEYLPITSRQSRVSDNAIM